MERQDEIKEELLNEVKKRAVSYVPEWRFHDENPDIGTALATVYADMLAGTKVRFERFLEKSKISFFQCLDADVLPATPAKGYVCFSLVDEQMESECVPAHTLVYAESDETELGKIPYEVEDEVYVTPAKIECIYQVFNDRDYLEKKYDKKDATCSFYVFDTDGENLQSHMVYFGTEEPFDIHSDTSIDVLFQSVGERLLPNDLLERFLKQEQVEITYSSEEGFLPFKEIQLNEHKLIFHKGKKQPPFAKTMLFGEEKFYIRFQVKNIKPFKNLILSRATWNVKALGILPDSILADGVDASVDKFLPFGENLSIYNECYICSNEVLGKKGANITLSFFLKFLMVPLDGDPMRDEVEWDWIMNESSMKERKEYEISIGEVIWEYYNGVGWKKLKLMDTSENVFEKKLGSNGSFVKMRFICPEDIHPFLVNAEEGFCIRARISKLNNMYKINGYYLSPIMERTLFEYGYDEKPIHCESIYSENNHSVEQILLGQECYPWKQTSDSVGTMYFGLSTAPIGGPIKLLFLLEKPLPKENKNFTWEYYQKDGWKRLYVVDQTEQCSKTGVVTFVGRKDFCRASFFGEDLYWIRVKDETDYFGKLQQRYAFPHILDIKWNATKVQATIGGNLTNQQVGGVKKLGQSIGYINQVTNPTPLIGGYDEESVEDCISRNAQMLTNQNFAITRRDYERIAKVASRSVRKAKCYSGYDKNGDKEEGAITLVVLTEHYKSSSNQFHRIKDEIVSYFQTRMNGNTFYSRKLYVIEPKFVKLCVSGEVITSDYNYLSQVRKGIQQELSLYLNPIHGSVSRKGWDIGVLPNKIQIRNVLIDVPHVTGVNKITVLAYLSTNGGWKEVDFEQVRKERYCIPMNGEHEIEILVR